MEKTKLNTKMALSLIIFAAAAGFTASIGLIYLIDLQVFIGGGYG